MSSVILEDGSFEYPQQFDFTNTFFCKESRILKHITIIAEGWNRINSPKITV